MMTRLLLLFGAALIAAGQTSLAAQSATAPTTAPSAQVAQTTPSGAQAPVIRFEDASEKAHIDFVHSFGSAKLGSLLEGTGAGCVWFDYNNSGLLSLYVANGRPLDDSMHPYPLKVKPDPRRTIIYIATTAMAHSLM
ncbi:MAG: hypothetical protein WCA11_06700 [Terracidiphilus sp.]